MGRTHDQPDPSLILEGKRTHILSKRKNAEDSESNNAAKKPANKKNTVTLPDSESSSEEEAPLPSKQQRRKEKLNQLSTPLAEAKAAEPPTGSAPASTEDIPRKKKRTAGPKHLHRLDFPGRPQADCAVDHPSLSTSDSLAWTFLILTDVTHDSGDQLLSGTVTCGFCVDENRSAPHSWTGWDKKKSRGSTGNFLDHFKKVHFVQWEKVSTEDAQILDPTAGKSDDSQVKLDKWAEVSYDTANASRERKRKTH